MSAGEVALRSRDAARRTAWRRRQVRPGQPWPAAEPAGLRPFPTRLAPGVAISVPAQARRSLLAAADNLLAGHLEVLGVARDDMKAPDWFLDPVSGQRAPQERYCFAIDHRSEEETGNVKQVWELSRHHHLTTLAAAWFVSEDDRYAAAVDRQLRDWWQANPNLSGVHWTSGIEIGIRLISWTWIRRLLDAWPGTSALFEANDAAANQIWWHQRFLAAFPSAGTSANNHVIAEAAGQLVAGCAFPWFAESGGWRSGAASRLERELAANTFPSGVNRELASDYHCLVAELGLVAAVEAEAGGHPLGADTWALLGRAVDAAAAMVDERAGPPRQGDGDDGRALLVDAPEDNHWRSLLAAGAGLFGPLPWWPGDHHRPADVRSTVLAALGAPRRVDGRPAKRPTSFEDAGFALLRTPPEDGPEIWCRFDAGPHGFLAIAAHAHADALSVEVRHGGVEVLADPGTYCYHGDPAWRAYFRSTIGHSTLELEGQDQSVPGGPFLWTEHATTRLLGKVDDEAGDTLSWSAEHDGYRRLAQPALHRRTVTLDRVGRRLTILDQVDTEVRHRCRLAFHLGPSVAVVLQDRAARLTWPSGAPSGGSSACLDLPAGLSWSRHRGETGPVLGWYSAGFGRKEPTTALVGTGLRGSADGGLETILRFDASLLG